MAGSHVKIAAADGGSLDSYVAAPPDKKGAGVVFVSTISGVDSDMIHYADALAAEGFVASAPDMFWRDADDPGPLVWNEDGRKRAFARNSRYDLDLGMRDLADVIAHLKKHPQCNGKIAVMGFCFGSPFALLAAARYGIDAGISFHGSHVEDHLDEGARVRCPLSFHYGDRDEVAPMAAIERIQKAFARLDDAKVYIYPGAGHGFMTMTRGPGYRDRWPIPLGHEHSKCCAGFSHETRHACRLIFIFGIRRATVLASLDNRQPGILWILRMQSR